MRSYHKFRSFWILSGFSVHGVAAAAVYVYLAFALWHTQILAAARAFEKAEVLALAAAILSSKALTALFVKVLQIDGVFHLTLLQLSGKGTHKSENQHKGAQEEKQGAQKANEP